jgi:hypothetical protein
MIEYEFVYEKESRPRVLKKFTASSGETFAMSFGFDNEQERNSLTNEQIYIHLENLLLYIKDKSQGLSLTYLNEPLPTDGWHLKNGWAEIDWANLEINKWWKYAYYREETDEELGIDGDESDV